MREARVRQLSATVGQTSNRVTATQVVPGTVRVDRQRGGQEGLLAVVRRNRRGGEQRQHPAQKRQGGTWEREAVGAGAPAMGVRLRGG